MQQSGNWNENARKEELASSSNDEEVENELSGEASNFGEKEKTITEVIEDDPNEILFPNPIAESGQATEVELRRQGPNRRQLAMNSRKKRKEKLSLKRSQFKERRAVRCQKEKHDRDKW